MTKRQYLKVVGTLIALSWLVPYFSRDIFGVLFASVATVVAVTVARHRIKTGQIV